MMSSPPKVSVAADEPSAKPVRDTAVDRDGFAAALDLAATASPGGIEVIDDDGAFAGEFQGDGASVPRLIP